MGRQLADPSTAVAVYARLLARNRGRRQSVADQDKLSEARIDVLMYLLWIFVLYMAICVMRTTRPSVMNTHACQQE